MKELIKHLLKNNKKEIVEKSLLNCHVMGLHSIMLIDSPGKTVRLYISDAESDMYKNHPNFVELGDMSLGFHPHHCNLTLYCIYGGFINWTVKEDKNGPINVSKYRYQSKIKEGEQKITFVKDVKLKTKDFQFINEGETIHLKANEIHTVCCFKGINAWLVFEGEEDENYKSVLYTNNKLIIKDDRMYKKPSFNKIKSLLQSVKLI